MDVNAYLNRIGLHEKPATTLPGLRILQRAHLLHVPFENLDIHDEHKIILDTDLLFQKVVHRKRGGFCYELNGLFFELLTELGFEVKQISARVFSKEKGYGPEFDHHALIVRIEGQDYLSDVGFGEFAFAPLAIKVGQVQQDDRGQYTFQAHRDDWIRVEEVRKNETLPQYIFQPRSRRLSEFESMCHFHQTSPESHFTKKRLISLPTVGGRMTLSGNLFKVKDQHGETEHILPDSTAYQQALTEHFGFPE